MGWMMLSYRVECFGRVAAMLRVNKPSFCVSFLVGPSTCRPLTAPSPLEISETGPTSFAMTCACPIANRHVADIGYRAPPIAPSTRRIGVVIASVIVTPTRELDCRPARPAFPETPLILAQARVLVCVRQSRETASVRRDAPIAVAP